VKELIKYTEHSIEEARDELAFQETRLHELKRERHALEERAKSKVPGTDAYRARWEQEGQIRLPPPKIGDSNAE